MLWKALLLLAVVRHTQGVDVDRDGLDDAYEMSLAAAFSPHFYFHPGETYFPMAAEAFVNESTLVYRGSLYSGECVLGSKGFFTGDTLPSLHPPFDATPWESCMPRAPLHRLIQQHQYNAPPPPSVPTLKSMLRGKRTTQDVGAACGAHSLVCFEFFDEEEEEGNSAPGSSVRCSDLNYQEYVFSDYSDVAYDETKGFSLELGEETVSRFRHDNQSAAAVTSFLEHTPVYVHVFPTPASRGYEQPTVTVQYWLLFPFSGEAGAMLHVGQHEGDWEHVSLIVDNSTHAIVTAYFAAHSHESSWLTAPDYEVHDGHVRVFVAHNTHASYPTVGRKGRMGGVLSDECSSEGVVWQPDLFINMGERDLPMPNTRWLKYNGFWGSSRRNYGGLPFPTGFPPRTPSYQTSYWLTN